MQRLRRRRPMFYALLLTLSLIVACGEGEICGPTRAEKQAEDLRNAQMFQMSFPPTVSRIEAKLAVPVTTYTVTASHPVSLLTYEWSMTGEQCGTPVVPWTQSGASVPWSHSDRDPDRCKHIGTDHAVVATVVVRNTFGSGVECSITGTETLVIDNPPCKPAGPRTSTPTPTPAR